MVLIENILWSVSLIHYDNYLKIIGHMVILATDDYNFRIWSKQCT